MAEHGRGAWNNAGVGGTKKYKDATKPGPYYFIGTGQKPEGRSFTDDEFAVYRAVVAYQRALNRRLKTNLTLDGWFGKKTSEVVFQFQTKHEDVTGTPWGGIGPDTSKALLYDDLVTTVSALASNPKITPRVVSGTVNHESQWDAGAVGYTDPNDLGLAQINGRAHPDMSKVDRLSPVVSFGFVIGYYEAALRTFSGNLRDAVASYNLGAGGTRTWIAAGRPDTWTPAGSITPRNVKGYIDSILAG